MFDLPLPYALGLQDVAAVNAFGLQVLHDTIMFYLIVILIVVLTLLIRFISTIRYLVDIQSTHGKILELYWTITPAIILIMIALPSFRYLYLADEILDPTISIKAIGRQWYWTYEYTDYNNTNYDSYIISTLTQGVPRLISVDVPLVIPIDTQIRLLTTSSDVIHSLGIPSLGLKADCIPGRLNQISLFINRSSIFYGQCSELCGINHSMMPIVIYATNTYDYIHWINNHSN